MEVKHYHLDVMSNDEGFLEMAILYNGAVISTLTQHGPGMLFYVAQDGKDEPMDMFDEALARWTALIVPVDAIPPDSEGQ